MTVSVYASRPFGISTLVVGFSGNKPKLYQTDPSGIYTEWKANAVGRNSKTVHEWLEKNYKETSSEETLMLAVKALLEVGFAIWQDTGVGMKSAHETLCFFFVFTLRLGRQVVEAEGRNIEVVVMKSDGMKQMTPEETDQLVKSIVAEKEEEESRRPTTMES